MLLDVYVRSAKC